MLCSGTPRSACAEVSLYRPDSDGLEFYTSGRVNAFFEYSRGDGFPRDVANGHVIRGGGINGAFAADDDPVNGKTQGTIDKMRIASGFIGNVLGFGVKRKLTDTTTVRAHVSLWMHIESDNYRKYKPSYPDAREGYVRFEGPWGSVVGGRALTLFSRGATEIDFLYGHGYGLGFPGDILNSGPAAGHIGFGVLANGFAAGLAYATPKFHGLKLEAGLYDPAALTGSQFERVGWLRPEAELTYDAEFGSAGKLHLFGNGTYQRLYGKDQPDKKGVTAAGVGYGLRLELGPAHLGLAGHYGKGLGLNYALEASDATYSQGNELRISDGYYAQGQLALGTVDVNLGAGVTRIHLLDADRTVVAGTNDTAISVIHQQFGLSAALVYHAKIWLHFDVDYFRADFSWQRGEKQVVNFLNAGTTLTW